MDALQMTALLNNRCVMVHTSVRTVCGTNMTINGYTSIFFQSKLFQHELVCNDYDLTDAV